jgi:hypothetical protein
MLKVDALLEVSPEDLRYLFFISEDLQSFTPNYSAFKSYCGQFSHWL